MASSALVDERGDCFVLNSPNELRHEINARILLWVERSQDGVQIEYKITLSFTMVNVVITGRWIDPSIHHQMKFILHRLDGSNQRVVLAARARAVHSCLAKVRKKINRQTGMVPFRYFVKTPLYKQDVFELVHAIQADWAIQ